MKTYQFIFLISLLSSLSLSAQKKQKKGNITINNSEVSIESGKITGRVVSIQNNKEQTLEFASVSVFKGKDSTNAIGGGLTDTRGIFEVNDLPLGTYRIVIQSLGFEKWKSDKVKLQSAEENLGKIVIKISSQNLDEVIVSEQKQEMTMSLDKKIFNVGANLTTVGGTALDVLQNVPSIIVTPDGEIQMRGSGNLLILIDGRPSGITTSNRQSALEMLPADVIENIEIKEVLLWRNKIAAHFAITDPRKDDNIATLEASLFYPAIFDNERYRTGAMIFSRGQENISVESNIPYWSPTEVFELVAKRFMPDVNFNN